MISKTQECEICGYSDKPTVVNKYPDGVYRCSMCADRAALGRYIPEHEIVNMPIDQLKAVNKRFAMWLRSL